MRDDDFKPKPVKAVGDRPARVAAQIRAVVAEWLRDPPMQSAVLQQVGVTVSDVRLTPDLRYATVLVMPLGGQQAKEVIQDLKAYTQDFMHLLAQSVHMKYLPKIQWQLDASYDTISKVEQLLEVEKARLNTENGAD